MIENLLEAPLHSRADVLSRPSPAPRVPGVYAWFFKELPPGLDATDCLQRGALTLLYIGIAPRAPTADGRTSRSHLAQRLRTHFAGNAAGSTLRLTLGCLLSATIGVELRRVGSTERRTFTNPGEQRLDAWLAENARVSWVETSEPWRAEAELLASGLSLPLNIEGNLNGRHTALTSGARRVAARRALGLPIILDSGGPRRG